MKIAVDLDGVIYDWEGTARHMLREELKRRGEYAPVQLDRQSTEWDMIKSVVSEEMWGWLFNEAVEQGVYRYGNLIKGALDGVRWLADRHDVSIVTARPKNAVGDTLAWCSFMLNRVKLAGVHVLDGYPKSTVPFDVLVDDGIHNIREVCAKRCVTGLLFSQPWNEKEEWQYKAKSWNEVCLFAGGLK